jgi:pyrroline-5-carboxylate reductase
LTRKHTASPEQLIVSDPNKERLEILRSRYSVVIAQDNLDAAIRGNFIFINVRPHVVDEVVKELSRADFPEENVVITLAAGIPLKKYNALNKNQPVVRALPNPPSEIGWGISPLAFNDNVAESQQQEIIELFSSLGKYVVLDEDRINAVTALSSPAPIYMFFQALIDAAVRSGIDRETATKISYQTIVGAMEVWKNRKVPPSELMNEASTPGGISVEELFVLEKYAFRAAINEAIYNATLKAEKFSDSL